MPDRSGTLVTVALVGVPFVAAMMGYRAHLPVVGDLVHLNRPMAQTLGVDVQWAIGHPFRIVERVFSFPIGGPDAGAMVCCLLLEGPPTGGEEGVPDNG